MRPQPLEEKSIDDEDGPPPACDANFSAIVQDRRSEQLRQGRVIGQQWVDSEKNLRPFAEQAANHDGMTDAKFSWEARRAMYSHLEPDPAAGPSTVRDLAAYRIGVAGGGFEVFNKIGHDVSPTDVYGDGYTFGEVATQLSGRAFGVPRNDGGPEDPSVVVHQPEAICDFEPASHPPPPWFPNTYTPAVHPPPPQQPHDTLWQTRNTTLHPSADISTGAATNACLEIDEAPPPYPQGSELILWSEEDLRDFCAKYSLDHTGDRPALERRVRAEMRSKTDAKLEKLTGAPPAGVSTRPLFKFEFATDAKLAAKLGQAREPQRLEPATKSVLVALRRAVNQQRSLYGRGMRDLHECFVTMDEDGSGDLSAVELSHGFHRLGIALSQHTLQVLFALLDADDSGKISYGELLRIMNSHQVRGTEHVNGTEAVDDEEGPFWLPLAEFRVGNFCTRAQPPTHANGGSELGAAPRDNEDEMKPSLVVSLKVGSRFGAGGKIGGAVLVYEMWRNEKYRNRGKAWFPLSDVIGMHVNGDTLTLELCRPPATCLGHCHPRNSSSGGLANRNARRTNTHKNKKGHSSSSADDDNCKQWQQSDVTTPDSFLDHQHPAAAPPPVQWGPTHARGVAAEDALTNGEIVRNRFHVLKARSAAELQEWKEAITAHSYPHRCMVESGLPWAARSSGSGVRFCHYNDHSNKSSSGGGGGGGTPSRQRYRHRRLVVDDDGGGDGEDDVVDNNVHEAVTMPATSITDNLGYKSNASSNGNTSKYTRKPPEPVPQPGAGTVSYNGKDVTGGIGNSVKFAVTPAKHKQNQQKQQQRQQQRQTNDLLRAAKSFSGPPVPDDQSFHMLYRTGFDMQHGDDTHARISHESPGKIWRAQHAARAVQQLRRPGSAGYVDRGLGDTSFTALIAPTAVAACNTLVQYNALRQYESAGAVTSGNADNNAADVAASISAAWQSSAVAPSAISYVPAAARPSRGGRSRSLGATAADGVANNNRPTAKGTLGNSGWRERVERWAVGDSVSGSGLPTPLGSGTVGVGHLGGELGLAAAKQGLLGHRPAGPTGGGASSKNYGYSSALAAQHNPRVLPAGGGRLAMLATATSERQQATNRWSNRRSLQHALAVGDNHGNLTQQHGALAIHTVQKKTRLRARPRSATSLYGPGRSDETLFRVAGMMPA